MRAGAVNTWFYLGFGQIRYLHSDQFIKGIIQIPIARSERECNRFGVQFFENCDKRRKRFSVIVPVSAENTGKTLLAVERDPRELTAVIVQKSGSEAHAALRRDIGARRIVVRTVEIIDLPRCDKTVLNCAQRLGRAASDHQRPAVKIFFCNKILL